MTIRTCLAETLNRTGRCKRWIWGWEDLMLGYVCQGYFTLIPSWTSGARLAPSVCAKCLNACQNTEWPAASSEENEVWSLSRPFSFLNKSWVFNQSYFTIILLKIIQSNLHLWLFCTSCKILLSLNSALHPFLNLYSHLLISLLIMCYSGGLCRSLWHIV